MRVLVCGGRDFEDAEMVRDVLAGLPISVLIEGGAQGADRLAREYADRLGLNRVTYRAEWARLGRAAGVLRNWKMLADGKPDLVVAFPGGRGTADMVRRAQAAGVRTMVYT
jgi:hypothetical protein